MSLSRAPLRLLQSSSSLSSSYASTFLESGLSSFKAYSLFSNPSLLSFLPLLQAWEQNLFIHKFSGDPQSNKLHAAAARSTSWYSSLFCNRTFSKGRSGEGQEAPEKEWYQFSRRPGQVYQETFRSTSFATTVFVFLTSFDIRSAFSLSSKSDLLYLYL